MHIHPGSTKEADELFIYVERGILHLLLVDSLLQLFSSEMQDSARSNQLRAGT